MNILPDARVPSDSYAMLLSVTYLVPGIGHYWTKLSGSQSPFPGDVSRSNLNHRRQPHKIFWCYRCRSLRLLCFFIFNIASHDSTPSCSLEVSGLLVQMARYTDAPAGTATDMLVHFSGLLLLTFANVMDLYSMAVVIVTSNLARLSSVLRTAPLACLLYTSPSPRD